jgi:hypothetical protein
MGKSRERLFSRCWILDAGYWKAEETNSALSGKG